MSDNPYTLSENQATMSDNLPDDVLKKILSYLPPKSLVRFTSVSKSWKSLITSSEFIADHLNQTKLSNNISNNHLILLRHFPGKNEKDRYHLYVDNYTFDRYDVIELPFQSFGYYNQFRVLGGSVNGLICLCDDYGYPVIKALILWNPSIRKSMTLPLPNFINQTNIRVDQPMGFGFDSRTNDYKVVRVTYLESDKSPKIQLFKLSTGSWETITATVGPSWNFVDYIYSTQVFINGAVHWPAFRGDFSQLILSFNMSDEVFHEMSFPVSVVGVGHFRIKALFAMYGEFLSFFDITENRNLHQIYSVWVMKEYGVVESWTKLYTFDLKEEIRKMLGFRRNGELLLAMKNKQLFSYDPQMGLIKYLGVCDSDKKLSSFHVDAYVESLVLFGI